MGEAGDDDDISIIYPSDIRKYHGHITKNKDGHTFKTCISLKHGKHTTRCFSTYDLAFNHIKEYCIRKNLVKNVVYDYGTYLRVSLTQGKFMLCDRDALPLVERHVIYADFHASNKSYYATVKGEKSRGFHNLIMDHIPSDITVDHINRKTLDNRKINLRLASRAVQIINRGPGKNNKTGIVGVSFDARYNMWRAWWMENKKLRQKSFSCLRRGHAEAKRLAIEHRRNMEKTISSYREALLL